MRCKHNQKWHFVITFDEMANLEIAHQATPGCGRHLDGFGYEPWGTVGIEHEMLCRT